MATTTDMEATGTIMVTGTEATEATAMEATEVTSTNRSRQLTWLSTERIIELMNENTALAERYMARPEVWRAVLALADSFRPGRTLGRAVARTVLREHPPGRSRRSQDHD
jgi:hypothetical protein